MAIQPLSPYTPPANKPVREKSPAAVVVESVQTEIAQEDAAQQVTKNVQARAAAQPSREQVDRAMNEMRRALDPVARNLQFSIDEETGRTVVKVVDASTNEVIRQIPSEELLELSRTLDNYSGLFVKQKV